MAEIINEMPEELKDLEEGSVEVDLEPKQPVEVKEKQPEAKEELDFEIEEEDDTPTQDRGREPLPKEVVEQLENDTLEDYSSRVKERMAQFKKVWHDERRAKEAADRERHEAIKFAQQIADENRKLKATLSVGEEDYLKALKDRHELDVNVAKRDYKEAYENGDTDKIIEAQTRMNDAQFKLNQASGMKPQYNTLQNEENSVKIQQTQNLQAQSYRPDDKTLAWQDKNPWFGKNKVMTATALGLHDELLSEGIQASSDVYFRRINSTMHKLFPEHFGDDSLEAKPAQRKPSTVVAPATRSTAPKKVRLSKTQVAFAKKLKLTPEQYAREMIKLENANG